MALKIRLQFFSMNYLQLTRGRSEVGRVDVATMSLCHDVSGDEVSRPLRSLVVCWWLGGGAGTGDRGWPSHALSHSLSRHTAPLPQHTRHWPIFSGFTPRLSGPGCRDQQMKFKHRGHHRKLVQSIAIKSPDLYVFYPSNLDIRLSILPLDLGEEDKDPTCQTVTHCIKEWRKVGLFKTGKMWFV